MYSCRRFEVYYFVVLGVALRIDVVALRLGSVAEHSTSPIAAREERGPRRAVREPSRTERATMHDRARPCATWIYRMHTHVPYFTSGSTFRVLLAHGPWGARITPTVPRRGGTGRDGTGRVDIFRNRSNLVHGEH